MAQEAIVGPILVGEEIKRELTKRRSTNVFKTVTASRKALIKPKVELEEKDGWLVVKRNKKSVRMAHEKPLDEQLEDEIWCLLAQMGFKELSHGRNFRIQVGENTPPRQIDVFGKDDETAILIECTQCETPKVKSMVPLIEKLKSFQEDVHKAISSHYGRETKLKAKLVIATRNVVWRDVDVLKCKEANIAVITDEEIDYYKQLVQYLKRASRYQLLAHLFEGVGIGALEKQVAATRGSMGGVSFYNFLIHPHELLKIAYIGHKSSRNIDSIETYQRMAKPTRLNKIAKYIIEEDGKFPTNIVVNMKTDRRGGLRFDSKEKIGDASFGTLYLPNKYASAWVIDGQHRLYGYAYAAMLDENRVESSTVPVLAFENLDPADEMNMFIDINSKQVKVQKALLIELYSELHWNSPRESERQLALLSKIVDKLNSLKISPIHNRVIVTGKKKNNYRCLTQTSLADGLEKAKLLGHFHKEEFIAGPLAVSNTSNLKASLLKAVTVLSNCLQVFATEAPDNWKLGDAVGGYLCTNISIRAIFLLIQDICSHIVRTSALSLSQLTADELVEEINPYLEPVAKYFKHATPQQISAFRRKGSSLAAVNQQSLAMGVFIREGFPDFNPPGLQEYIDSRDEAGTEDATIKINKISVQLFEYVKAMLKAAFGNSKNDWYVRGVPKEVRKKCMEEWDNRNREGAEESFLTLIQYQAIALENWDLMKGAFALDNKDKSNRKQCVKWVKELNDIRSITHHPEHGILSAEQVAFVDELAKKVAVYFALPGA